jgi:sugar O-acyltransferase (sialic acid O-acetyltransferase NeuD family)
LRWQDITALSTIMAKPVVIVGAGRQGRSAADALETVKTKIAGYLDDTKPRGAHVFNYPVLNSLSAIADRPFVLDHAWFVAIGDNYARHDLYRKLDSQGATFVNAIHPTAQIARGVTTGRGLFIAAGTVACTGSAIGDWALVGSHAFFGTDSRVGEATFIGHGVILSAGASVGARSFLGSGTILSNDASVGADCVVGAGSLVMKEVGTERPPMGCRCDLRH